MTEQVKTWRYQIRLTYTGQWVVFDSRNGNQIHVRWLRSDAEALAIKLNEKEKENQV